MNRIRLFTKEHTLSVFFALAYAFTWLGWLVPERIYTGGTLSLVLALPFFLMIPGPLLASLVVSALVGGKAEVLALLRKFTIWHVGFGWYLVALFLMPAMSLAAIYLNAWLGGSAPPAALFGTWSSLLLTLGVRMINPADGPMQEELGWRGFALPRLQARYSPLTANLILGLLVVVWHMPLALTGKLPAFTLIATVAATILFGWIFNNTRGSVLLTLIAHAADGLFIVRNQGMTEADITRLSWLQVAVWCTVALVVVVVYGPTLVRRRTIQVNATPVGQSTAAE